MSIVLLHHNESIFPQSHTFLPERWLAQSQGKRLDKYMVSFGRGSRQCLGMEYVHLFYLSISKDIIYFKFSNLVIIFQNLMHNIKSSPFPCIILCIVLFSSPVS